ncbi:MAG: hypothetical protein KJ725_16230 [Gammaproteobacteria bacterium]|nr:hypothetical protein [Gammaproteobacteria bacterium]
MSLADNNSKTIVIYSLYPETHACPIIRLIAPLMAHNFNIIWAAKRINSEWSFDLESTRTADLIIIQRHFPANFTHNFLKKILTLNIPIIYELDDMLLDLPNYHPSYENLKKHSPYIKWILKSADVVIVSTPTLKESLQRYNPRLLQLEHNLVKWSLFNSSPRQLNHNFNFLISGTSTHEDDWLIILDPLLEILKTFPNVNAIFFGELPTRFLNHPSVQLIKFQDSYEKYASILKELPVHCALVPLKDTYFNRCKSNIKWLEYSAAGIPGIYSDVIPYRSSIFHEKTGLLVSNTYDAWFNSMYQLVNNPKLAHTLVKNAQIEVFINYSIEKSSSNYINFIQSLVGSEHKRRIFAELSIQPTILKESIKVKIHSFLNKYILWRFNKNKD